MLLVLANDPQQFLDYVEKNKLDRRTTHHICSKHQAPVWDADSRVVVLEEMFEDGQIIPFSDDDLIIYMKEKFAGVTYDQI